MSADVFMVNPKINWWSGLRQVGYWKDLTGLEGQRIFAKSAKKFSWVNNRYGAKFFIFSDHSGRIAFFVIPSTKGGW